MSFILNPLFINIILVTIVVVVLIRIVPILLKRSFSKSTNVYQYKIYNLSLSWIICTCYIILVIFTLYLIRVYLLPHSVDLLLQYHHIIYILKVLFALIQIYNIFFKLYIIIILLLIIIILMLFIIVLQKALHNEIHKLFLYYNAKDRKEPNKFFRTTKNKLFDLFLSHDILLWFLQKIVTLGFSGEKYNNTNAWDSIPRYHPYRILHSVSAKGYYTKVMRISPLIILLYDCIWNNFIVTHVFYYLLFYVPLMLLKRIALITSTTAPYINEMLYDIYYKEETCLYIVSPDLKLLFDSYLLSDVKTNYDLGLNTELVIVALSRFELAFKHGPLNETYVNEDGEFIHTDDRIHYYHVIPDDDNTPIHGTEWQIIANKIKE